MPDTERWLHHTPVMVDDIASTARIMIAAVGHVRQAGLSAPVCVAIHHLFAGNAFEDLQASGVARTASCDAIPVASLPAPVLAQLIA